MQLPLPRIAFTLSPARQPLTLTVVDATTGVGVPGIHVAASQQTNNGGVVPLGDDAPSGSTDADGKLTLGLLCGETYNIAVNRDTPGNPDYQGAGLGYSVPAAPALPALAETVRLQEPRRTVVVSVTRAGGGAALAGISVSASSQDDVPADSPPAQVTGADGTCALPLLTGRRYVVFVNYSPTNADYTKTTLTYTVPGA